MDYTTSFYVCYNVSRENTRARLKGTLDMALNQIISVLLCMSRNKIYTHLFIIIRQRDRSKENLGESVHSFINTRAFFGYSGFFDVASEKNTQVLKIQTFFAISRSSSLCATTFTNNKEECLGNEKEKRYE